MPEELIELLVNLLEKAIWHVLKRWFSRNKD